MHGTVSGRQAVPQISVSPLGLEVTPLQQGAPKRSSGWPSGTQHPASVQVCIPIQQTLPHGIPMVQTTGESVAVAVAVGVSVGVAVGVLVGVFVGVLVGVLVAVGVCVGVEVAVFVAVGVLVGVRVGVVVRVGVAVFVGVGVLVGVRVGVAVRVGDAVFVAVAAACGPLPTQRWRPVRSAGPQSPEQQSPGFRQTSFSVRHPCAETPDCI
jgi:hypothetical protein